MNIRSTKVDRMIVYRKHKEIDKIRWDECIRTSVNRLPYARSWFLDIVSPGWDALEMNDYGAVFPLTHNRKFGIRYLYQPYFAQQLGIFSSEHLTAGVVDEFLQSIPARFLYIHLHLNSMNKTGSGIYELLPRLNHELDLIPSYESIFKNYNQNTRRNIRKALDHEITIRRKVEPDELIGLFTRNYGRNEPALKFRHYEILRTLMNHCIRNTFSLNMGAYMPDNTLCAGVFLLRDQDRFIFHFAASDKNARENGAMFLLVDSFIKEHSGQPLILDFEGSNDPDVARFYKGFGAKESVFHEVVINRLPGWIRWWFNFQKNVRQY
ncbi:MAG: GNAT family N-acetyltransferase [Bacteroidetes bacterium]|nr:GNAT family N-acetyltransferase [Bacteroidota bacterium]